MQLILQLKLFLSTLLDPLGTAIVVMYCIAIVLIFILMQKQKGLAGMYSAHPHLEIERYTHGK